jgi:hypothetical protein
MARPDVIQKTLLARRRQASAESDAATLLAFGEQSVRPRRPEHRFKIRSEQYQ